VEIPAAIIVKIAIIRTIFTINIDVARVATSSTRRDDEKYRYALIGTTRFQSGSESGHFYFLIIRDWFI